MTATYVSSVIVFFSNLPLEATPVEKIELENEDDTQAVFEERNLSQLKDVDPFIEKDLAPLIQPMGGSEDMDIDLSGDWDESVDSNKRKFKDIYIEIQDIGNTNNDKDQNKKIKKNT
ncbi:hypothetical protein C2845_PM13G20640 [Panicum miliaceum]|uniref:Uncharacterized protein n=1 Tax=Panicum miliaceum TaxID=4540 RepID=A0A3L6RIB7_PANMI|nr:hypothetical protein C2845_PM13G20640 [Panicum miliaceum]